MLKEHIEEVQQTQSDLNQWARVEMAIAMMKEMTEKERWQLLLNEYDKAHEAFLAGKNILFFLPEDTTVAGHHASYALYEPAEQRLQISKSQGKREKGQFPTVLHSVEVIPTLFHRFGVEDRPYPTLTFVDSACIEAVVFSQKNDLAVIILPLVVNPKNANVLEFHTQARHIDPETVALEYYGVLQGDTQLGEDTMRHTMLLATRRLRKNEVHIWTAPMSDVQGEHELLRADRITRWEYAGQGGIVLYDASTE